MAPLTSGSTPDTGTNDSEATPPPALPSSGFASVWGTALVSSPPRIQLPQKGFSQPLAIGSSVAAAVILVAIVGFAVSSSSPGSTEATHDSSSPPSASEPSPDAARAPGGPGQQPGLPPGTTKGLVLAPGSAANENQSQNDGLPHPGTAAPGAGPAATSGGNDDTTTAASGQGSSAAPTKATTTTSGSAQSVSAKPKTGKLGPADFTSGRTVTLRSPQNGKYVRAEMDYTDNQYGMLRAVSAGASDWEQFTLVWKGSRGAWAIRSNYSGLYVSAEILDGDAHSGMLRARSDSASDWELFDLYRYSDGTYSFRSDAAGAYVAAEIDYTGADYGVLRGRSTSSSNWERFTLS